MQKHRHAFSNIRDQLESRYEEYCERAKEAAPKLTQGLALFFIVFVTYKYYMSAFLGAMMKAAETNSGIDTDSWWKFSTLLKFVFFNSWPFAALAFFNKDWSSTDATKVAFPAFALASAVALHHYGLNQCPRVLVFSVPFLGAAALGHAMGGWRHPSKPVQFDD